MSVKNTIDKVTKTVNDVQPKANEQFIHDKNSGLLMSGSEFDKSNFEAKYVAPTEKKIPIKVIPSDSYILDDGNKGKTGLHTNLCSKSCCSPQFPVPFPMKHDPRINKDNDFVPNNLMCNNAWQDSGCLCLTEKQSNFLYDRGGNA